MIVCHPFACGQSCQPLGWWHFICFTFKQLTVDLWGRKNAYLRRCASRDSTPVLVNMFQLLELVVLHPRGPALGSCVMSSRCSSAMNERNWSGVCVYGGPCSPRGEPKLNKYLLHPVCIKFLHALLWRQSDIKQGGVHQQLHQACAYMFTDFHILP